MALSLVVLPQNTFAFCVMQCYPIKDMSRFNEIPCEHNNTRWRCQYCSGAITKGIKCEHGRRKFLCVDCEPQRWALHLAKRRAKGSMECVRILEAKKEQGGSLDPREQEWVDAKPQFMATIERRYPPSRQRALRQGWTRDEEIYEYNAAGATTGVTRRPYRNSGNIVDEDDDCGDGRDSEAWEVACMAVDDGD